MHDGLIGALFLLAIACYATGSGMAESAVVHGGVDHHAMAFGALLMLGNSVCVAVIGVLMHPILRVYNEHVALAYVVVRCFEGILLIVGIVSLLSQQALNAILLDFPEELKRIRGASRWQLVRMGLELWATRKDRRRSSSSSVAAPTPAEDTGAQLIGLVKVSASELFPPPPASWDESKSQLRPVESATGGPPLDEQGLLGFAVLTHKARVHTHIARWDISRVIDSGPHDELMTRCELYQRLARLQFQTEQAS